MNASDSADAARPDAMAEGRRIYLDYLTTSPLRAEVREAMRPFLEERFGHPGGLHREGHAARDAVQVARGQVAALLNAESPESILFTGSVAEAINLAVKGAALAAQRQGKHLVLSTAEQPAVTESVEWLKSQGFESTRVAVDGEGRIDPQAVAAALRPDTTVVCLHHANLDIGTIQPAAEIGEIVSAHGAAFFLDATASAGWMAVDVQRLKADLAAIAPHRFYGPKGIGVLYRQRRARLAPLLHGTELSSGDQIAGIAGAGRAAEIAREEGGAREVHARGLQTDFLRELGMAAAHWKLNGPGPGPGRAANSANISFEFIEGEGLALMLDVRGVAVASGAACVTKTMRVPPVLAAIGLPESLARGNVIVSFGEETTCGDIRGAVEKIARAVGTLREMSPEWEDFKNGRIESELER